MRPKKYCDKFLPWTNTSRGGEVNDVCVDRERMLIKRCDACIDNLKNELSKLLEDEK